MFKELVLCLALALPAAAQFDAATVLGTVRDPSGASIAGATVTFQNRAIGLTQTAATSSAGEYQFTNVPIGDTLDVTARNMRVKVSIPSPQLPFGNAGRNTVGSPAFWQVDLGVYKNFSLSDRVQFRAESFNAFNRTNFGTPDANISNASFGTIRSTFDPRQFQFAVKLLF